MRIAAISSFTAHVVVLVLFFAIGTRSHYIVPGPDVVQVALISPQAIAAPPPVPAKPEPEPATETVKPTDETGVRLAPLKPRPKPVQKPREKEPEPAPNTTTLPATPAGPGGLTGELVVDAGNFEFTYYLLLIRNRVNDNWSPPSGLGGGGQPVRATVFFRIDREGEVTATRLEGASGAEFFDRSALRAIQISSPMPPLPLGYSGAVLGVHYVFEYIAP